MSPAFVLVDATGVRTVIPVGGLAAIMLEPGTRASSSSMTTSSPAFMRSLIALRVVFICTGNQLMAMAQENFQTGAGAVAASGKAAGLYCGPCTAGCPCRAASSQRLPAS